MNYEKLTHLISERKSFLCVGLDPDKDKLPHQFPPDGKGYLAFNKAIIDATRDKCVAYKLNTAFYEVLGADGWDVMKMTIDYIGETHFVIADAKRGDIGNTSRMYADAFFNTLNADAITVAPYMGKDSIEPFYNFKEKWVIILGLTSNVGSRDFQFLRSDNKFLYEKVLHKIGEWGNKNNTMVVVGATHPEMFETIREILPDTFLLVPGVGAQGGDLKAVYRNGKTEDVGLLVNSTRSIIYAGGRGDNFIDGVREAAMNYQREMAELMG